MLHFRLASALPGEPATPLFRNAVQAGEQSCQGNHSRATFLLCELRREAEEGARYAPAVQDSLLETFFWRIARGLPEEAFREAFCRSPQAEARREKLAGIFQRHLKGNPAVVALAADAKMSPRHFTTLCAQLFGEGPARFLLQLKLRRAEERLRYRGPSVKEVSDAFGFANPYHFSRAFERVCGRPPSKRW